MIISPTRLSQQWVTNSHWVYTISIKCDVSVNVLYNCQHVVSQSNVFNWFYSKLNKSSHNPYWRHLKIINEFIRNTFWGDVKLVKALAKLLDSSNPRFITIPFGEQRLTNNKPLIVRMWNTNLAVFCILYAIEVGRIVIIRNEFKRNTKHFPLCRAE